MCTQNDPNHHIYPQIQKNLMLLNISNHTQRKREREREANLCCTVIPIIEQSTKDGNTEDGIKS